MSYVIDIVVPAVPDNDDAAWAFVEGLRERYYDDSRERAPALVTLHGQVTAQYPCPSSYSDGDPAIDDSPWADSPLINNFCSEMGMLALSSTPNLEAVVACVVARACQLGLTVFDPQEGRVHRPLRGIPAASHGVSIDGIVDGFAPEQVVANLARMVKRDEAQIRALLAAPGTVVKRGLDLPTAEKYLEALTRIGCACRISPSADAALAPASAPASRLDQVQEAARGGDAEAQHELSKAYALGEGLPQDEQLAAQWLEKAADQGYLPAICVLASCYYVGQGVFKNYAVALHWASIAAERGNPSSQFLLWRMYAHGEGAPPDQVKAERWLARAAEQGHAQAQFQTGKNFYRVKNLPFATMWFAKAAEQGNADAQCHLAVMYTTGEGVERHIPSAVSLNLKAAEQGHAIAQFNLGVMMEVGEGVVPDDPQALRWFHKAAAQGHAGAEYVLGTRYKLGLGVERDLPRAFEWMLKSSEHGNALAQSSLALMYLDGKGVRADEGKALFWIKKAAAQGDPDALRFLATLNR